MTERELKKLYKPEYEEPIGNFRVRVGTYNQDTSFPIDLTQSDFNLLYDIRRYLREQNANLFIDIEKE